MKYFTIIFFAIFVFQHTANAAVTEAPDDDDDWEDTSSGPSVSGGPQEVDDDGRVYKNPRNSPSAVCPRDEEQATLLGQKCLRKCSSDEDCKSKKKKCLCDGACGMSCIKPDRECPELDKPELGDVTLTGRLFGDKAVYSCPHGYHVVGLQSRNCQADGQWAGQAPACKQNIYCLTPPHIEHARHSALPEQATFDLDATIQYHCHTGYVTNGFPRAKCLAIEGQASWYGPDITCEPRSCGPPGELPHGWVTAECHTFGCRAALHCGAGFELVGRAERFCQSDGTWAPNELPTCVLVTAVQCPTPEAPRHGRAIYTSCAYNSIVSYECKYGYRLIGDNTRRCGADKKWSGTQPVCKEINCGHPGRLYNGWLENIEAGTGLGASIIFRCHDGMRMEGNSSTVCQQDGSWRYPLPRCLAPCVVPHVAQGKVILLPSNYTQESNESTATSAPTTQIIGSSTMVHHGDALIVECEKNYEFPSNTPAVTCNNGTWTQILKCQPARCKRLPKPPKNGMVIAPKTDHGMRARFHCKDGFTLKGPELLLCSFGNWTGEMPICQEVYCPFPGYIENGKVLLVGNMGLYDYRPYVKKVVNNKQIMYDCDKGYVLLEGPPGATCIGGQWSPRELPNCTLGQHPRLRWSRRRRSAEMNKRRHLRKYYHHLRKRSNSILNYQNLIRKLDFLDNLDGFIADSGNNNAVISHERRHNFDDLRNVLTKRFRRKRQVDDYSNKYNRWHHNNKLYRHLRKRSMDFSRPFYENLRKHHGYNFFGLHPRAKRDTRNRNLMYYSDIHLIPVDRRVESPINILPIYYGNNDLIDILPISETKGTKVTKRNIDIKPVSNHHVNKRSIDVLPFDYRYEGDHFNNERSTYIFPFSSEFISHKIGKRDIDQNDNLIDYSYPNRQKRLTDIFPILEIDKKTNARNRRSIDVLPIEGYKSDRHIRDRRNIDVLPFYDDHKDFLSEQKRTKRSLNNIYEPKKIKSHKIEKRSIDVLPVVNKHHEHILNKRSIDVLPIFDEHHDHILNKRSIDVLPIVNEHHDHILNKRSIDVLPIVNEHHDHILNKRSIDVLPIVNEHHDHILNKRSIDVLPVVNEHHDHILNKKSIDVLPVVNEHHDHVLNKRSIDVLPIVNEQHDHILNKRSIDVLPIVNEHHDHILNKRSIDVLPIVNEHHDHILNKRSIDVLPVVREQHDHILNKRSIDVLPVVNEHHDHILNKRTIDVLPIVNEHHDHILNKRSIDVLPIVNEHHDHILNKRSIDVLPVVNEHRDHILNKRSIDVLPVVNEHHDHILNKRSIDVLPIVNEHHDHILNKRSIDVLPVVNEHHDHILNKRSIDVLPVVNEHHDHILNKRSIDVLPVVNEHHDHILNKRSIDVLPIVNEHHDHILNKRSIDVLPVVNEHRDHILNKRSIDVLPIVNEHHDHILNKRSIDVLPVVNEHHDHILNKRSIDVLPVVNEHHDHILNKRSIDVLPVVNEHHDHILNKRSIDVLPIVNEHHDHILNKRSIDVLPVVNEHRDHILNKRSIDVLPIVNEHHDHILNKRSIDVLPVVREQHDHILNKRSIDVLPVMNEHHDHILNKRSIDVFPVVNEHHDHILNKRTIDVLPMVNEHYDHTLNKRSIDILPAVCEHYDHILNKRSIDVLPEANDHILNKRSIDVLPIVNEQYHHILNRRSIDVLPAVNSENSHLILNKRSIDVWPVMDFGQPGHVLHKRFIDVLPLVNEQPGYILNKRSIDILPMADNDQFNRIMNKRSIDILPLIKVKSDYNLQKRSIDIMPVVNGEQSDHIFNKRLIEYLHFNEENINSIHKRNIDILPFQKSDNTQDSKNERTLIFLSNGEDEHFTNTKNNFMNNAIGERSVHSNNFQNEQSIDILPYTDDEIVPHKKTIGLSRSKRSIDILPFHDNVNKDDHNKKVKNSVDDASHSINKRFIDVLPLASEEAKKTLVKRDVNGMKNSYMAKKYEEMKKQWEEEMAVKKTNEKTQVIRNVNFQVNPPLKVDPKEGNKNNQSNARFKDLPKVSAEDMIKRMKRTSRKTERLNQTTLVPKNNKDNKNRQVIPSPGTPYSDSTIEPSADADENGGGEERGKGGRNGEERGKGRGRVKGPCDPISSEPYVNVEVVKFGRDPNITYSSGTIVRVACGKGYGLNLGYNSTAKCVRGRWKPMKPICEILPCHIPVTDNGIFTLSAVEGGQVDTDTPLNETVDIANGQVVQFACETGYNVQGASNLRCWHGDWAVTSMPECVPAPCELPVVSHGVYSAGYRPGLTTAHGSAVTLHCERGYAPPAVLQCSLGEIRVRPPEPCQSIEGNISSIREGQDFRGGSDIVSEDFDELEYPTSSSTTDCGPPARVQGTLIYRDGAPASTSSTPQKYPHGTEVTFRCIAAIMGERSTWKIVCDKGKWAGKSVSCDEEDMIPAGLLHNATCTFRNNEANVVSFFNDLEIKEEVVEFPAGAILVSRCVDIGKYAMIGPNRRKCVGGEWDGSKPSCFGLNQENDYAMEKPPTILFRHQLGPIMQSNDGKMIVYPGTILHMECLWMRKFGNPKWNVSHEYRKYPEGWSSDPGRDSYLEYRLSIFHAVQDDSGVFTCITPARQSHQVEIVVEAVHCAPLPIRRGLISSSQSTKMGSEVSFSCANGNSLIGAAKIMCLPSGNWSAPLPLCESIECGEVVISSSSPPNSRPRVSIVSRGVGGRAAFSCSSGWGLRGPAETVCSPSGEWMPTPPTCVEVSCPPPAAPTNGYLLGKAPFRAGDVVQFNCNPAHMMQGQPIVACQDNGRWSGETPKCIQACSYPGTTISGRMSSVKFYYKIGETISFTCEPGLILRGAPMLRCLRNGKWSNAIPICSRESSSNETFLSGNDSDQLLNDAPILSDYLTTETSVMHLDHNAPSHSRKSDEMMSFTGEGETTASPRTPQTNSTKKTKPKLTKSKTYFKFNQNVLLSSLTTLSAIIEERNKTEIVTDGNIKITTESSGNKVDKITSSFVESVDKYAPTTPSTQNKFTTDLNKVFNEFDVTITSPSTKDEQLIAVSSTINNTISQTSSSVSDKSTDRSTQDSTVSEPVPVIVEDNISSTTNTEEISLSTVSIKKKTSSPSTFIANDVTSSTMSTIKEYINLVTSKVDDVSTKNPSSTLPVTVPDLEERKSLTDESKSVTLSTNKEIMTTALPVTTRKALKTFEKLIIKLTPTFSSTTYSTVDNSEVFTSTMKSIKNKQRKIVNKVQNCTEVEDAEDEDDNVAVTTTTSAPVTRKKFNRRKFKSTVATVTNTDINTRTDDVKPISMSENFTKINKKVQSTSSPTPESRRTKNKVSLDLLSLFQEIDKIENKNNSSMYAAGTSKKKDLSQIKEATNEEIEHIKKQLGIETNSKRKLKNR